MPESGGDAGGVAWELVEGLVAVVRFARPPANFLDRELVAAIADAYEELEAVDGCRAIALCPEGRHFCPGLDFGSASGEQADRLYAQAVRLFSTAKPVVAAVSGATIGGGLGLALSADLRVVSPGSRLAANFALLGIHHGFGTTVTLPRVVGQQKALELLYTGRRLGGEEALGLGLADRLVDEGAEVEGAIELAREVAASAPLALAAIRRTMRGDLAELVREATDHEFAEQLPLFGTDDFREGVAAYAERRRPEFSGR